MNKPASLAQATFAIVALLAPVCYGLILRPLWLEQAALPLEIVFISAAIIAISQLAFLGFCWQDIQQAISEKLMQAIPTLLLLFAIGLLIASWLISGTIPMLVYFALDLVSPQHIYLISFLAPIAFSLTTGTSWGSIATIGLVLITVGHVIEADLAIMTGAIVGGAYFGDKVSPLSDTTNIAAAAVNVDLYQHIQSMMVTTLPSALLAAVGFASIDMIYPANDTQLQTLESLQLTLRGIESLFYFHWLLLLPPLIVIIASIKRKPPLPTLVFSTLVASILAVAIQGVSLDDVIQTLYRGFNIEQMSATATTTAQELPPHIAVLFNRGGLYALNEPVIITILVFIYVGALTCTNAIGVVINRLTAGIKRKSSLICASLSASALTNAMTSSQYANSFIVGEAFASQYDNAKIERKVLSRSLEDTGTLIESLVPWSTTAVFIYASLGVSVSDYWHWQLLSLINIPLAFCFALFGIGCFYQPSTPNDKV